MLTDRAIKALKAPAKGQVDVSDGTDAKGLVLRVSQRSKVFYLSYRSPANGKAAKIRLGEYPALGLAAARERGRAYRSTARLVRATTGMVVFPVLRVSPTLP